MTWIIESNNQPIIINGPFEAPEGIQRPANWPECATPEEREELKIYFVAQDESPTPADSYVSNREIRKVYGQWRYVNSYEQFPIEHFHRLKIQELEEIYASKMNTGFPIQFNGISETLQISREKDSINWLGLKDYCQEQKDAGHGDDDCLLQLRTTSNQMYSATHNEILAILNNLRMYASSLQAKYWQLKDQISACNTTAELALIDLNEGW